MYEIRDYMMNLQRQWAVVKAVMVDMERGKGTHNKGCTRTMGRAVCPPRHESRRVLPMPGIAPCITCTTSRAVCRPWYELRCVAHATSCIMCRATSAPCVACTMCRAVHHRPRHELHLASPME